MSKQSVVVVQAYRKNVEALFEVLTDHNRLSQVFMIPVKRIQEGEAQVNGVGSVRRLGPWPLGVEETVTAWVPNRCVEYRITRNAGPVKNHRGRLDFNATPQGSEVKWTIEFDTFPAQLGPVLNTVLRTALTRGLKRIASR